MSLDKPSAPHEKVGVLERIWRSSFGRWSNSEIDAQESAADVKTVASLSRQVKLPEGVAIASQSICTAKRTVIGQELLDRSVAPGEHSRTSDERLLFNALALGEQGVARKNQYLFLNCTPESLEGRHLELVNPARTVLELGSIAGDPVPQITERAAVLAQLRQRGFLLSFDHQVLRPAYAAWRPYASFIKLDARRLDPKRLPLTMAHIRQQTTARLIATKVETQEQFDHMAQAQVALFQGFWLEQPSLLRQQKARPRRFTLMKMIQSLERQTTLGELLILFRSDPVLSYLLLKYQRAAGLGPRQGVAGLEGVLRSISTTRLHLWASQLLLTTPPAQSVPALDQTAMVRGHFLVELYAQPGLRHAEQAEKAYLVGLLSVLDQITGQPISEVLQSLELSDDMTLALAERGGDLGLMLDTVAACENNDMDSAEQLANRLGLRGADVLRTYLAAMPKGSLAQAANTLP